MPQLYNLVKEHNARQAERKHRQDVERTEAVAATNAFTQALISHLNARVSLAYQNQKRLDVDAKKMQANTAALVKQTNAWLTLSENFNHALKEVGDVENWASTIETDVAIIADALENAYKANHDAT